MTIKKLKREWYALHTKSKFENVVSDGLSRKSIEVFLPKVLVRSKRRDRKQMIRVPLFPGYLFVKTNLNPAEHLEIVKTSGAVQLVGSMSGPVSVPSENIESLKIMVSADEEVVTDGFFQEGDRVMVVAGPFSGMKGTFIRYKGKGRVAIYISVFGQSASVEVDEEDVELLPQTTASE